LKLRVAWVCFGLVNHLLSIGFLTEEYIGLTQTQPCYKQDSQQGWVKQELTGIR